MNELQSTNVYADFLIAEYEIRAIEGKLLTIVESIGLPVKQEEAVKGLVRQAVWDEINKPHRMMFYFDQYQELRDMFEKKQKSMMAEQVPPSGKIKSK